MTMQRHDMPRRTGAAFKLLLAMTTLWGTVPQLVSADSHSPAVQLGYESALSGYKKLDGTEPPTWKESNETVGEIGGWRSYANEAYKASQAQMAEDEDAAPVSDTAPALASAIPDSQATRLEATPARGMDPSAAPKAPQPMAIRPAPLTVTYQSATRTHRVYADNPRGDWRAANERVGEIGGWRTYAKQAYEASKRQARDNSSTGASQ